MQIYKLGSTRHLQQQDVGIPNVTCGKQNVKEQDYSATQILKHQRTGLSDRKAHDLWRNLHGTKVKIFFEAVSRVHAVNTSSYKNTTG